MRPVAVTGRGAAGPWGVAEIPPAAPWNGPDPVSVRSSVFGYRPFTVRLPDPATLDAAPAGLSRRQLRYLGRNARLALAACRHALDVAGYPEQPAAREPVACLVASSRGSTDPETTLEMIRAARLAEPGGHGRPVARAAHETYMRHRPQVQYLKSMETAVVGHLTAAFGARGPAHAVTTPGLAGGAQALLRAVRIVARGDAPAALACGVFTAEDEPGAAELLDLLGGDDREAVEGAGALLLEDAETARRAGREVQAWIDLADERFDGGAASAAPGRLDEREATPFAGAARALWSVAEHCGAADPTILRGMLGHEFRFGPVGP